jgi:hypothetical protein
VTYSVGYTIRGDGEMTHSRKVVAMLACCVAASAVLVGHASARVIEQERFHDEGTFVIEDFCGVAGLTVSDEFVFEGMFRIVQHGPDGFEYFAERLKETEVLTNLANGKTVTLVNVLGAGKDLKLTDNGDGTLTAITFGTGNTVLYGADGKAIARNPGQSRFELLIDLSDGELINIELILGSTGRNDDICGAAVEALT